MDNKRSNNQDLEKDRFIFGIAILILIFGLVILISGAITLGAAQSMSIDVFSMTHAELREVSSKRFDMFSSGSVMISIGFFIAFFLGLPLLISYYDKVTSNDDLKHLVNPYDAKRENAILKQKPKEEPEIEKSKAIVCQFCGKTLSSLEARCGYCKVLIHENEDDDLLKEVLIK